MYQEQRNSQSHTMTSSQRSSLNKGQHGRTENRSIPRPPRRFRPGNHEGRQLYSVASLLPRQEKRPLGSNDLRRRLNQASGQRHNTNVHDRIGTSGTRYANLRNRSPTDYNPAPFQIRRHDSITGCQAFSAGLQAVHWLDRF